MSQIKEIQARYDSQNKGYQQQIDELQEEISSYESSQLLDKQRNDNDRK